MAVKVYISFFVNFRGSYNNIHTYDDPPPTKLVSTHLHCSVSEVSKHSLQSHKCTYDLWCRKLDSYSVGKSTGVQGYVVPSEVLRLFTNNL